MVEWVWQLILPVRPKDYNSVEVSLS